MNYDHESARDRKHHHDEDRINHKLEHIDHKLECIMSVISDFAAKWKAYNDRQEVAWDGLKADIKALKDKIAELQGSAGTVTPEDQVLLDAAEAAAKAAAEKAEALDAETPPAPPV